MIQISIGPSNDNQGILTRYPLADSTHHPDTVPAAWEDAILDFIYSEGGWYTCVVAEVEETQGIVGYCVWEWYEYDEKYKRIDEAYRPTKVQAIWDLMGTFHALRNASPVMIHT